MVNAHFNPERDIPDQSGRVFFITGGTTGLGASSISFIASHNPAHIFFSGRSHARADELISKVSQTAPSTRLTFIQCDLADLASVEAAAKRFLSMSSRLDVLMCNAGIMATPAALSKDGYELQFATNHLSHALLIKLLMPVLLETAKQPESDVRIINLSSVAYRHSTPSSGIEFSKLKTRNANYGSLFNPNKWVCYAQSKLSNLLYPVELATHFPNIMSVAVHPGFIRTDLHANENFFDRKIVNMISGGNWLDANEGAYNQTWAATTDRQNLVNGAYYEPFGVETTPTSKQGQDRELAKKNCGSGLSKS
ncbi:hypothetical protein ACJQWK_11289 [Exserohilum turcicum]|uniref:Uncharacterized protein n=1 Tax=Exserohilum turcicum (strain 28A) TaxID=671987 RepID=R0J128_EXST2|nr:uncharacterized protein SETTUDRAFT_24770 [Exserohilum turcica Et28A]EOA90630.1 hypothetical protein SETTUDRAFT_24770 [Exserohilum turcica Et28A]